MGRERRPSLLIGGSVVATVALIVVVVLLIVTRGGDEGTLFEVIDDADAATHDFVVPPGAAVRTAMGEDLGIVPQRLQARVGDTIRIRNDDDVAATVGIFFVGSGDTVTMRFTSVGTLEGSCDVHPSGRFTIDVKP